MTSIEFATYSALNRDMFNECICRGDFFLHDHLLENRDLILELRKSESGKLGSF